MDTRQSHPAAAERRFLPGLVEETNDGWQMSILFPVYAGEPVGTGIRLLKFAALVIYYKRGQNVPFGVDHPALSVGSF